MSDRLLNEKTGGKASPQTPEHSAAIRCSWLTGHRWSYRGYDREFKQRRCLTAIFGWRFECIGCGKKRWLP